MAKTKMVNKKKKKFRAESNWRDYYGSNAELLEDIKALGKDSFKREIIHFCKSKGHCSYWEVYEQLVSHAIPSPDYYNRWLDVRIRGDHLKDMTISKK